MPVIGIAVLYARLHTFAVKNQFQVRVQSFSILRELPGAWTSEVYRKLFEELDVEVGATESESDLRALCLMALQDLEPAEAAVAVLKVQTHGRLNDGQARNLSVEMLDEKKWEHYADMTLHESIFNAGSFLYEAFPSSFPEPDAVQTTLEITAANAPAKGCLARPMHESLLVRILADGMDARAILHRLFDEQLLTKSFPEAASIVWNVEANQVEPDVANVKVISSGYWLDALRDTQSYESNAWCDTTPG